jgi:hypothetical protein
MCSSETSLLITAIRRHKPEDGIAHSHSHENLKTDIKSSVLRLLVTANVVPSSPIFIILMMEALGSSET